MRALRSVLAVLFAVSGGSLLFGLFVQAREQHFSLFGPDGVFHPTLLIAEALLPASGALFLLAAVSYWRKWRLSRPLCLLLGFVNLLGPLVLAWFFWSRGYDSFSANLIAQGLLLGLGAVVLLAFWRWDPVAEKNAHDPAAIAARPGDGTLSFLNRIHFFADAILFWVIYDAWSKWAWNQGLARPGFMEGTFDLVLGALLAVTLHELGHTLCGLALGQRLLAFFAGPFQWRFYRGRWQFLFNPVGLLTSGGATATVPQRVSEPEWRELCMVVAGPLVSLLAGASGIWAAIVLIGTPRENLWFPLAMFGSISLQSAFMNLIPLRTATGYSDGARIMQILRGGVWVELDRAYRISAATIVTQLRPRDYNIDAIHRVLAARLVPKPQQLYLHLLAHSYYLDHRASREACNEMIQAAALYNDCANLTPAEFHSSFIIEEALSRRDPAQARLWWDRMEAKKPTWFNGDYWMARSSLCWLEGHREESHNAWTKAQNYLATMPRTGTYEFDRDILAALKRIIEAESPSAATMPSAVREPVFAV